MAANTANRNNQLFDQILDSIDNQLKTIENTQLKALELVQFSQLQMLQGLFSVDDDQADDDFFLDIQQFDSLQKIAAQQGHKDLVGPHVTKSEFVFNRRVFRNQFGQPPQYALSGQTGRCPFSFSGGTREQGLDFQQFFNQGRFVHVEFSNFCIFFFVLQELILIKSNTLIKKVNCVM